ncbi:MAG TPA: carboxylating nicotinate-nucleotide diphosphorylase [Gammaproteobacteria bacterium]|nr:carboxylating nicotinate-nucleotide diphosphorylase [Gammaproteobacteria bacterium]
MNQVKHLIDFRQDIKQQISFSLQEDIGNGDITASLIPAGATATAAVFVREAAVICGQDWFNEVYLQINRDIDIKWQVNDGDDVVPGQTLCTLTGQARSLLTGERTALNFLQTLSATATLARKYATTLKGLKTKILDTRKTVPGLRLAQKYAVKCGGCNNHRIGLYDAILIKENHIMAAGSIKAAMKSARQTTDKPIEVEIENLLQLEEALNAGATRILLDNMDMETLEKAVAVNAHRAELEASGGIRLENVRATAETGVDYISVGSLTKNIKAIDLSMRILMD